MSKYIKIRGAREHNLKNIDVDLPRDKFIVITGISGSGKSTLAFDTIFAEGQRRYVESLSPYARQFLGKMMKPKVESIEGLSPSIAIEQKNLSHNPRSTVGTTTEIFDYLRLLYARIGIPHCPKCGKRIERQSVDQIVDQVLKLPVSTKIMIIAPIVRDRKGSYQKLFENLKSKGYQRIRIDGEVRDNLGKIVLDKNFKHSIDVVVDRLVIKNGIKQRLAESIEHALFLSEGIVYINIPDKGDLIFSEHFACIECGISFEQLAPRNFSFNSPWGSCTECEGLGSKKIFDIKLIVPDPSKSIREGAIVSIGENKDSYYFQMLESVADYYKIDLDVPFHDLTEGQVDIIFYGSNDKINFQLGKEGNMKHSFTREYEGIINSMERRYRETQSQMSRRFLDRFIREQTCPSCKGKRLKPESLAVLIGGKNIIDLTEMQINEIIEFFDNLTFSEREKIIGKEIIKEIKNRLNFLLNVGLDYITLDRNSATLSAGEAQRIHLATQIGSNLVGVLYVLDEPSVGLHQRDNERLLSTLEDLRNLGNTVIVVEHDHDTILRADHVLDLGPGAGRLGGHVVVNGPPNQLLENPESITGRFLSGKEKIEVPKERRTPRAWIEIQGAKEHNLKDIDVKIPLGVFVCVTGVSGAGKSTLINDILYKSLARDINRASVYPGKHTIITGIENIDKVINIDQSPIGRTARSNPATYSKVFDPIRQLFAETKESKMRGYKAGRFSFNVKGGRCEACEGAGVIKIDLVFLAPVYVPCEVCKGTRFNRETLEIKWNGKNISEILEMTVAEALEFFDTIPKIKRILKTLSDVGLDYIHLGQTSPSLSGGEAQRVKLARELSKKSTGQTFYLLDEPTTGLSTYDIKKLLNVLKKLVDKGNTVLIIEHNMDVIKCADWIIDLGPEGGDKGGEVVFEGTPEKIIKKTSSYTGKYLKKYLK
ncbi:MAG: excinuclease ABC subunit UvrA [Candidatus Helarchaeota archaeon]